MNLIKKLVKTDVIQGLIPVLIIKLILELNFVFVDQYWQRTVSPLGYLSLFDAMFFIPSLIGPLLLIVLFLLDLFKWKFHSSKVKLILYFIFWYLTFNIFTILEGASHMPSPKYL